MHQRLRTENIRPAMNNGTTTLNVIADTVWMCEASDWRRRRLSDWVVRILFEGILEQQAGYDPISGWHKPLIFSPPCCGAPSLSQKCAAPHSHNEKTLPLLVSKHFDALRLTVLLLAYYYNYWQHHYGTHYYHTATTYIHTYIHTHNCIHTSIIYT